MYPEDTKEENHGHFRFLVESGGNSIPCSYLTKSMKIARTMTQEIESFEHVTIELLFSKLFSNNMEKRGGYLYSITAMNES